ncbi:MAG: hypothetical protein GX442_08665 [Candidatus Riflebacteria bacterium]|nr:hypothetical protein [Candidatus Riflebacteria bacterium]
MRKKRPDIAVSIEEKRSVLERARQTLAREFVGIDEIIDALIWNVSPWFFFPEIQDRPIVINLWGMTGVGKSSLVKRLAELLAFEDRFFRFDLGDKSSCFSFSDTFAKMVDRDTDASMMVAFDEIQHSRTLDEMGKETTNDANRNMWEILDSGKIRYFRWDRSSERILRLMEILAGLLARGVEIEKGIVTRGHAAVSRELGRTYSPRKKELFVREECFDDIQELAGKKWGLRLKGDVERALRQLDGPQTVEFLGKVAALGSQNVEKRFSRLLVFVMGNLDEAYDMTRDFDADVDADRFYRKSLEIGVPEIREALKSRFRAEQIARLGNIHIIYPAIQRQSFERVIAAELQRLADRVKGQTGISLDFTPSVHRLVYAEGVCPTQGFRPIFSTVHQLLASTMGFFLSDPRVWQHRITRIRFEVVERELRGTCHGRGGPAFTNVHPLKTPMTDLRKGGRDDEQANTAVHESGHAVVHMVVERHLPKAIVSAAARAGSGGFLEVDDRKTLRTFEHHLDRLTTFLGGFAAERLLFGKPMMGTGSTQDLQRGTAMMSFLLKRAGLGNHLGAFGLPERVNNEEIHDLAEVEADVRKALEEALRRAEVALQSEWPLFLRLADHLADHGRIEAEEILEFCRRFSRHGLYEALTAGKGEPGHRQVLKQAVQEADQGTHAAPALLDRLRALNADEDPEEIPAIAN